MAMLHIKLKEYNLQTHVVLSLHTTSNPGMGLRGPFFVLQSCLIAFYLFASHMAYQINANGVYITMYWKLLKR